MPECIDAHHHLWQYSAAEYPWMSDQMPVLRQDYLLLELEAVTSAAGVTGTIAVQARQTIEETSWLLDLAESTRLIRGVVGWAPLVESNVGAYLEQIAQRPKLKGIRHVLQDEADELYMLRPDFNRGIALLERLHLRYDILIFARHLPQALQLVDRHPQQIFILDHIAKPLIREHIVEPWRTHIRELARRENVYCKLSGMATEADWTNWTDADLIPYAETVLAAFGPHRLMFGSDWPVLGLASTYVRWMAFVRQLLSQLSADEQARVIAGTAIEAYAL